MALGRESFAAAGQEVEYDWACVRLAPLCLQCGDVETYRWLLRRMWETAQPDGAFYGGERLVKASLLRPIDSPAEAERLRALAEAAVRRSGPDDQFYTWYLLALGLADYRCGRFDAAASDLEDCLARSRYDDCEITARFVLAMVRERLGQPRAAASLLAQGHSLLNRTDPWKTSATYGYWHDRLTSLVFAREAEALIVYAPIFPQDPFKRP